MPQGLKVLHLVYSTDRPHGMETASAVSRLASEYAAGSTSEVWAPKETRPIPSAHNRAAESRITHRGLHSAMALRSFLIGRGIDIVHCHDAHAVVTMGFLKLAGRMPPVVYSVYAPIAAPAPGRPLFDAARQALMWMLRRSADLVIAPSSFARSVIISQGAFTQQQVWKVTYGVTLERPSAAKQVSKDTAPTSIMLLAVLMPRAGRCAAYYYFLHAAQVVSMQVRKVSFKIVCPPADRQYINTMAARFGVRDSVSTCDPAGFPDSLAACDVAVLPTGDFQGIRPLVLALGAGKAVVAPDLRGVREFVQPEETGLLVRPSDSQALAEALTRLASSPATRKKLADAAARVAAREFSARHMARQLLTVYTAIAGK